MAFPFIASRLRVTFGPHGGFAAILNDIWLGSLTAGGGHPHICRATLSVRGEGAGFEAELIALHYVIERSAEATVVIVFNGHEAEGLQNAVRELAHRAEDFGHAVHWPRLGLEGHFDEVSLTQRLRYAEQASGGGDGLEFGFGAAAVFKTNGSEN